MTTLDPAAWPADAVRQALDSPASLSQRRPASGHGKRGIVVGSLSPFGQLAGRKALEAGGSSVDAVVATACAQVALSLGSWVSYAGIVVLVHFDAASGEVSAVTAPYKSFVGETDPLTIPFIPQPSGRSAMVPGFFAGIGAAHDRFGRLAWADLLRPSIWLAEEGFVLDTYLAKTIAYREPTLTRTPEGRAIFLRDGVLPTAGEVLRQPELAETLTRVAHDGVGYVYEGEWARRFVEVVNREGGRATKDDLAGYRPVWGAPIQGSFKGYDVFGATPPAYGGAALVEGLQLVEHLGLGDPFTDPDSLRWFVAICRQAQGLSPLPAELRTSPGHVATLAAAMRAAGGVVPATAVLPSGHSDYVVAADPAGNVTAAVHTSNTAYWGTTGLFIDGIELPDPAGFQQGVLSMQEPGGFLPTPPGPAIVVKDGEVALACGSIGAALHEVSLQAVDAVLSGRADVIQAAERPFFHYPDFTRFFARPDALTTDVDISDAQAYEVAILEGAAHTAGLMAQGTPLEELSIAMADGSLQLVEEGADPSVVAAAQDDRHQLVIVPAEHPRNLTGFWGGIQPDGVGGWIGARTPWTNGVVQGLD